MSSSWRRPAGREEGADAITTPRVAAVAIDAAEWSVIERLMRGGRLPHLKAIAERGARARLRNVELYRSELVWVQFLTGQGAADHRWWGQIDFDPSTYAAYGRGTLDARPFYALGPDVPVVAFDLIHSVIADGVGGDQVTAWGAHSPQYPRASRPAGLLREIDRRFGTNPAFGNDFDIGWYEPDYIDNLAEACGVGARRRIEIAGWLQERVPDWRLLLTCMSEVHSARHPVAGDRRLGLTASGMAASLANPLLAWPSRIRRAAWFLVAGLVPGPRGREVARRRLPDGPGPRRGWPRNPPAPGAGVTVDMNTR